MAKYDEGNEVRLTKKISFNTTHIKPNTRGVVKKVNGGWGKKTYSVRFQGVSFDIIVPENSLAELSQGQG